MTTLVFFLEEPSARAFLESFLEGMLPERYSTRFVIFEGKSDMDKRLVRRMKYWQVPDCKFFVLRDQDSATCIDLKSQLREECVLSGHPETVVRIACRELESWYIGDLSAVEAALQLKGLSKYQRKRRYQEPDRLISPSRELSLITRNRYQKVAGSREIGKYLNKDFRKNASHRFRVFIQSIYSECGL